jgi:hypothetical protein
MWFQPDPMTRVPNHTKIISIFRCVVFLLISRKGFMKTITFLVLILVFDKGYSQSDLSLYGYVDSATFREAQVHPAPMDGLSAWEAFLKKEIRNPGTPGTVIVEFTINKDDHVPTNIKIYRSDNAKLNNEAIRVIKKSRWTSALANGTAVNYRMRQEIEFK